MEENIRELSDFYVSEDGLLKHKAIKPNCYINSLDVNVYGICVLGFVKYQK